MQADGYPALCLTSQFSIRFAERNYAFDIAPRIEDLNLALVKMKYWEIIADNLSKDGWSWGCVSAIHSNGRTIWIVDAHRGDGKRFVVRADEKLTAFADLNWRFAITRRSMHFTKANWARFHRHRRDPDPVGDVSKST